MSDYTGTIFVLANSTRCGPDCDFNELIKYCTLTLSESDSDPNEGSTKLSSLCTVTSFTGQGIWSRLLHYLHKVVTSL